MYDYERLKSIKWYIQIGLIIVCMAALNIVYHLYHIKRRLLEISTLRKNSDKYISSWKIYEFFACLKCPIALIKIFLSANSPFLIFHI